MIIWLTANSGAGKTTIGKQLAYRNNGILLDGDDMRASISLGAGFSKEEREEHNLRVARLAKVMEAQGKLVIVSVIAPFKDTRSKIDKMICPVWIYLVSAIRSQPTKERPYQIPGNASLVIDTDMMKPLDAVCMIESQILRKYW